MVSHKDETQMRFDSFPGKLLARPVGKCLLLPDWLTTLQSKSLPAVPTPDAKLSLHPPALELSSGFKNSMLSSGSQTLVCI